MQARKDRVLHIAISMMLMAGPSTGQAFDPEQKPILLVGASWVNGATPFDDALAAPFGGIAINLGSYLSLGDALVSMGKFVINEAQAGGTSFDSHYCLPEVRLPAQWQGYNTQFQKAVARVVIRNPGNPNEVLGYNALYVVIAPANDCLHSAAFGIPQNQARPCTGANMAAYVSRVIEVARQAQARGLTPIFPLYPPYARLDLSRFQQIAGLVFVADEQQYNQLADIWAQRLADDVQGAIVVDAWEQFEHLGDGLHPTPKTSVRAALRVVQAIHDFERTH